MRICAALLLEDGRQLIPFCRTRRVSILRSVGYAALDDILQAADAAGDSGLSALLHQEYARLLRGLETYGLQGVDDGER